MSWFHDPRFSRVRDSVINAFKAEERSFRRLGHVIFLCGGAGSRRRDRLRSFIQQTIDRGLVFYADDVWDEIARHATINALAMESQLAVLADVVMVVVESPGTFAELGAFSISDPLRGKLLPLLDISFRHDNSFINTGPVRWIDADSRFGPAVWVDLDRILECGKELTERLSRLPSPGVVRIADLSASPKHMLFFLCDLVAVCGPATVTDLEYYVSQILEGQPEWSIMSLVGLARAMDLINSHDVGGVEYYIRPLEDGLLRTFERKRPFVDLAAERARLMGALLRTGEGREVMAVISGRA